MNMPAILGQMAVLFLVLAVGYGANKLKVLTADSNKLLSRLVVNIAMPCTILNTVLGGQVTASGADAATFLALSFGAFALTFLLGVPLPRLLKAPKSDGGLYRFMIAFGNVGFMGFPVIQAIFGPGAAFYVMLFNIAFSVLCFSVGLVMVSGGSGNGKINFRLFINPTMIVSVLTIIIFYVRIPVPAVLKDTVGLISQMTTPAAMLVIGSSLAAIPFREVFSEVRLYPLALLKLILIPVLTFLIFRLFIKDTAMLGVLTALAAMPTASNATMLAMVYGGNEKLASKGIFLTTLLSVATIPLLVAILLS
jgi:predicted permease